MTGSLYMVTSPSGKRYIGITRHPVEKRWGQHTDRALRGGKQAICCAIRKYTASAFRVRTLAIADWQTLCELETKAIARYGTAAPNGYNLTNGGEGIVGYVFTEEARDAVSVAQRKRYSNPDEAEKLREQGRRVWDDPDVAARIRSKIAATKSTHEFRQRASDAAMKRHGKEPRPIDSRRKPLRRDDPAWREISREKSKAAWADPVFRARMIDRLRETRGSEWREKQRAARLGKKGAQASEERKGKIRAAQLASWADPETRARRIEGMRNAKKGKE